jgi:hypothetical protein
MDLSGRFNFWRVLILTRAITPPRVPASLWRGGVFLRRGWPLLLLVAVLAAGVALRLSQRALPVQTPAIDPPQASVPLGPAPSVPRW